MAAKKVVSTNKTEDVTNGFRPVSSAGEIQKLLAQASGNYSRVVFQLKGIDTKFESRMSDVGKDLCVEKPSEFDLGFFEELVSNANTAECLLLIYLQGQVVLGVTADFLKTDQHGLRFFAPSKVFKLQRRREARYTIPPAYDLGVKVPSPEGPGGYLRKKLIDISRRGLSFRVISSREAGLYRTGTLLKNLRLSILGREFSVDVEIRNKVTFSEGSAQIIKIGTTFKRIEPEDADFVESYVLGHLFN